MKLSYFLSKGMPLFYFIFYHTINCKEEMDENLLISVPHIHVTPKLIL